MQEFKPGDIVTLKSGGPKMTVSEIENLRNGRIIIVCEYFLNGNIHQTKLYSETLEKSS